jgi:hypothetical protein
MGKRELLLIVGFVIVGVVVYQVTAPEPAPGHRGFSFSRFLEAARREVRGNRASAELTTTTRHKLPAALTELRITGPISEVEVTGEDRPDVESTLYVHSNGYDEAEAKEYIRQSKLIPDQTASALILRMEFPQGGRQRGTLKLKVPARLHIRVEPGSGTLGVKNVGSVEVTSMRGEASLRQIAGRVEITHRGGEVTIEDVGSLTFNGRSGTLHLKGVRGDTSIKMEQGGEVDATGLIGRLDAETRNVDLTLDHLETTRGPIRINGNGGEISMKGLRAEARIEVRNVELTLSMSAPAPVEIHSEGERVTVTPPAAGGYTVDVAAVSSELTLPPSAEQMGLRSTRETEQETRVTGAVRGGGPTITVRATRGELDLRTPDQKPADTKAADEKTTKP